jgi:hypothetical protein
VVELCPVELGDLELPSIMLEMATCAIHLSLGRVESASMIPMFLLYSAADLGVALQALEPVFPDSKVMTSRALRRSFQILVSAGKRSGGDLSVRSRPQQHH